MDLSLRALNVRKIPAILNLAPESLYGEYVDGDDFTQKGVHMAEVSREKKKNRCHWLHRYVNAVSR